MGRIRDSLNHINQKRLVACQVTSQEIFKLPEMPGEETTIALALILYNLILNALGFGWFRLMLINPRSKKGMRYNLAKYFMANYDDLEKEQAAEKQRMALH